MRRLVDYDYITGITTWHEYDHSTRETHVYTDYTDAQTDVVLDNNHRMANFNDGWNTDKTMRRVAEIPMSVIHEYWVNKGIDLLTCDSRTLKRFLNDRDYMKIRTAHWVV